jgi:hypothetical protein
LRFILLAIATVYVAAFFLPVTDAATPRQMRGYEAFFWAFVSIVYLPMWLANPALWFGGSQFLARRWNSARNAALVAVALGVSEVWMWDDVPNSGFYVWIGSMILLSIASEIGRLAELRSIKQSICLRCVGRTEIN